MHQAVVYNAKKRKHLHTMSMQHFIISLPTFFLPKTFSSVNNNITIQNKQSSEL